MNLVATVDPWYVVACTAVPIAWGAIVHWLFAARATPPAIAAPRNAVEAESDEPNLP